MMYVAPSRICLSSRRPASSNSRADEKAQLTRHAAMATTWQELADVSSAALAAGDVAYARLAARWSGNMAGKADVPVTLCPFPRHEPESTTLANLWLTHRDIAKAARLERQQHQAQGELL